MELIIGAVLDDDSTLLSNVRGLSDDHRLIIDNRGVSGLFIMTLPGEIINLRVYCAVASIYLRTTASYSNIEQKLLTIA